jgi:hypothetical protein
VQECRHKWRVIPAGERKCDDCGLQQLLPPLPPYQQPGTDAPPPLPPSALQGSPLGDSRNR